ncbi:MAG: hypothetical protein SGPRY_010453 [Prymnesium sp.]
MSSQLDLSLDELIAKDRVGSGGKSSRAATRPARFASTPYERRPKVLESKTKTCNNCGVMGHLAGQCPRPLQCHACGSVAHAVANCPHREKKCDLCGKIGHLKAKCRQQARAIEKQVMKTVVEVLTAVPNHKLNRIGGKTCNNCGVVGHLAGQCPEPAQCHACGKTTHPVAECPHRDKACDICGKTGHLKVKCRQGTRDSTEVSTDPHELCIAMVLLIHVIRRL